MPPSSFNWPQFHERSKEDLPSPSLIRALEYVAGKEAALDLGGGALSDAKRILAEGFARIVEVEGEPSVRERAEAIGDKRLEVVISRFEDYTFAQAEYDLVNAQLSLPFTPPESFDRVFAGMKASLKPGGVFVGQLFGVNDSYNENGDVKLHTLEEVRALFSDMELIGEIVEEDRPAVMKSGVEKQLHRFTIIARKK